MRYFLLFFSLFSCLSLEADSWLFKDGKSDYTIIVSQNASILEHTAAKELQQYIKQISGAVLNIASQPSRKQKNLFVGYNEHVRTLTKAQRPEDDSESFVYQTIGNNLVIYGGKNRGTAYGVYTFLERELGVRWYSHDYTKVPRKLRYKLSSLNHKESPAFQYRHVMYYQMQHHIELNIHNKLNMHFGGLTDDRYGLLPSFWGGHTFSVLLSPDKLFPKHPEYFSFRNGKRIKNSQLCLSNSEVINLLTTQIKHIIQNNPNCTAYSLTQNDNQLYCECNRCKSLEKKYASQAGLLLWAVNQVAEAVEKEIPNAKIVTFAYQYTRKAPKGIKPHKNVIIRLCDIECCFMHPIEGSAENADFLKDLNEWSKLTNQLHIFDYVTGFGQYMAPYPNYHVLAANLRTFQRYHSIGVMEEGQYESEGGEFAELKQWILAKLLWNPYQDINNMAKEFIKDYYGPAAPFIQKYYDLCCGLVDADTHMKFDANHTNSIYTDAFINEARDLLNQALDYCCKSPIHTKRVEHILGQIMYLQTMRTPIKSFFNGTTKKFQKLIERDKIYIREHLEP